MGCKVFYAKAAKVIILMIMAVAIFSWGGLVNAETSHTLTGSVIDELTGAGLSGVEITLYKDKIAIGVGTTDSSGLYNIEVPSLGFYTFTTRKRDYTHLNGSIFINGYTPKDFAIMPSVSPSITAPETVNAEAGERSAFELQCRNSVYDTEIRLEIWGAWKPDNVEIPTASLTFEGGKLSGCVEPVFDAIFLRYGPDTYTFKFSLIDTATGVVLTCEETRVKVAATEFLEPELYISGLPDTVYTGDDLTVTVTMVGGSVHYDNTRLEIMVAGLDDPAGVSLGFGGSDIYLASKDGGLAGSISPESGEPMHEGSRELVLRFNDGFCGRYTLSVQAVNLDNDAALSYDEKAVTVIEREVLPDPDPPEGDDELPEDPTDPPGDDSDLPDSERTGNKSRSKKKPSIVPDMIKSEAYGNSAVVSLNDLAYTETEVSCLYDINTSLLWRVLNSSEVSGLNKTGLSNIIFDAENAVLRESNMMAGINLSPDAVKLLYNRNIDISLKVGHLTVTVPAAAIQRASEFVAGDSGTLSEERHTEKIYIAAAPEIPYDDMALKNQPGMNGYRIWSNIADTVDIITDTPIYINKEAAGSASAGHAVWGMWHSIDDINEFIPNMGIFPRIHIRTVPQGRFYPGVIVDFNRS